MNELLSLITGMVGDELPISAVLRLAPVLAPVVADLADGDTHLSAENRNRVTAALQDLERDGDL